MNKLTRYNLAEIARTYSSDKHCVVCTAYDVERLEAINAELLEALESLIANVYSCACTMPTKEEREAWHKADAAIAKAKGDGV